MFSHVSVCLFVHMGEGVSSFQLMGVGTYLPADWGVPNFRLRGGGQHTFQPMRKGGFTYILANGKGGIPTFQVTGGYLTSG